MRNCERAIFCSFRQTIPKESAVDFFGWVQPHFNASVSFDPDPNKARGLMRSLRSRPLDESAEGAENGRGSDEPAAREMAELLK
jgi:hypothetical protein